MAVLKNTYSLCRLLRFIKNYDPFENIGFIFNKMKIERHAVSFCLLLYSDSESAKHLSIEPGEEEREGQKGCFYSRAMLPVVVNCKLNAVYCTVVVSPL